jgi:multidrug efflux pump subunit AcrA (membrane-fusion protein)
MMNKRRILIYFIAVIAFIAAVHLRKWVVTNNRDKVVVTIYEEWRKHGKPVSVKEVERQDIKIYEKVTIVPLSKKRLIGHIPKSIQRNIITGQRVVIENNDTVINGVIDKVSENIDINTGLYTVEVLLHESTLKEGNRYISHIYHHSLDNVIVVPNDVIVFEGDIPFVWVVEDDKAYKRKVTLGERDGYGIEIREGLDVGDLLVVAGYTKLYEGNSVNSRDKE